MLPGRPEVQKTARRRTKTLCMSATYVLTQPKMQSSACAATCSGKLVLYQFSANFQALQSGVPLFASRLETTSVVEKYPFKAIGCSLIANKIFNVIFLTETYAPIKTLILQFFVRFAN